MPSAPITPSTHVPTIEWQSLDLSITPIEPSSHGDDGRLGHKDTTSPTNNKKVEIAFTARGTFKGLGSLAIQELGEQLKEIRAHIDSEVKNLELSRERFSWSVSLSSAEEEKDEEESLIL